MVLLPEESDETQGKAEPQVLDLESPLQIMLRSSSSPKDGSRSDLKSLLRLEAQTREVFRDVRLMI